MAAPVRATARLQLHKDFTLEDAAQQVEYFAALGISHLYLSPILTARAGSLHGYDVVDHGAVNPELGGEPALRRLVERLRAHAMGLIVDIVPNHMAVGGADNAWWQDLLEWGHASPYARFFDIDWAVPDPALRGRVLAPFLGKPYGEALADGDIRLCFDAAAGRFHAQYFAHRFPIAPAVYPRLLHDFPRTRRRADFEQAIRALAQRRGEPAVTRAIEQSLRQHAPDQPGGRERLHDLLERQHYRLAWWRTAPDEINWRRFFDISDLAGLRVEDGVVFEAVHATIFRLYREGLIDGLRVDHVDGLADPRAYCRKLRARLLSLARRREPRGAPPYLLIEKILAPGERLRREWRVDGTTGYTFMNDVNALLHDPAGEQPLTQLWTQLSGRSGDFEIEQRTARRRVVDELLTADFNATAQALHRIARSDPATRDITLAAIRRVLIELLVQFPVYRIYADPEGRAPEDEAVMAQVREAARRACRPAERPLVDLIDRWLGAESPARVPARPARRLRLRAIARFQQLSSPLAAKAVEDTAFYRHGRLLSRNEVGADPAQFATQLADFHAECERRQKYFPRTLLATATHDHKRGEDTRARLAVLSEISHWTATVEGWRALNSPARTTVDGAAAPAAADEYMLYQTLVGVWPFGLRATDAPGLRALVERVAGWQLKALREAKLRSGWIEPNLPYEAACHEFLQRLLDPSQSAAFLAQLVGLVESIAAAGAANGLAQTLLRVTTPGVPDLYQGTEFWDLSLVDPDNRRPVDYRARSAALAGGDDAAALLAAWRDGRIKQRLIARALQLREREPVLFERGRYLPLEVRGPLARHVVAFARHDGSTTALAVASRWTAALLDAPLPRVPPARWQDTRVVLPRSLRGDDFFDALTGAPASLRSDGLLLSSLLKHGPVALVVNCRGA